MLEVCSTWVMWVDSVDSRSWWITRVGCSEDEGIFERFDELTKTESPLNFLTSGEPMGKRELVKGWSYGCFWGGVGLLAGGVGRRGSWGAEWDGQSENG